MYGYEYEYDVLALLRILKYVQLYRPDEFEKARDYCKENEPMESAEEMAWGAFDQAVGVFDEETGAEVMLLYDKLFNRFFDLNLSAINSGNTSKWEPVRRKLLDLAAYYLCANNYTVFDVDVLYYTGGITVKVILSCDCYEPFDLANAVVNFLLALQQEVASMENRNRKLDAKLVEFPATTQEMEAA